MKAAVNAAAVGTMIATAASGLAGCHLGGYEPQILAPCVSGFQPGDSLTVRIGAAYDAKSDYIFEDQFFGSRRNPPAPSCAGVDGLVPGSVVTFELTDPADAAGQACSAWSAILTPEVLTSKERSMNGVAYFDGLTIAEATALGNLGGGRVEAARGLYTPSGNPDGPLVTATLPALAVVRRLVFLDDAADNFLDECFDAWVATWEPGP